MNHESYGAGAGRQAAGLHGARRPGTRKREIRLKVGVCTVCRTDLDVVDGDLEELKLPLVPGYEIVGINKVGAGVDKARLGRRAGVPWLGHTCGDCTYSQTSAENLCQQPLFTGYTRCQICAAASAARPYACLISSRSRSRSGVEAHFSGRGRALLLSGFDRHTDNVAEQTLIDLPFDLRRQSCRLKKMHHNQVSGGDVGSPYFIWQHAPFFIGSHFLPFPDNRSQLRRHCLSRFHVTSEDRLMDAKPLPHPPDNALGDFKRAAADRIAPIALGAAKFLDDCA